MPGNTIEVARKKGCVMHDVMIGLARAPGFWPRARS
jgi:hypothetical protein